MPKNIVISSDGTGQRSGERFEENRTNIYKLYRATKCGPDSSINPNKQYAFYDPGIGTVPPASGLLGTLGVFWAWIYNLICQATGLGLTRNIRDCYEAILRVYEPGDKIFLFGFSRGAYTVRCLGAVLHFCGIPTVGKDGSPLKYDKETLSEISKEAVADIYQHVGSPKEEGYKEQRNMLGERFRNEHKSQIAYPHFIGVLDTVAAVASYVSLAIAIGVALSIVAALSFVLWYFLGGFWFWVASFIILALAGGLIAYFNSHFKVAFGLPGIPWHKTAHFNQLHLEFADKFLNKNVGFARHAIAIDEHRGDFDRVPWGFSGDDKVMNKGEPVWLSQVWFAGNHADIGGGYPDSESRLSDAALEWMLETAITIPNGLLVDQSVLKLYPYASGMQHDETKSWLFKLGKKIDRKIDPKARLHPTAIERFALPSVMHLDEKKPYRPEGLRGHEEVGKFYETVNLKH
jgi:uncharacterized protein (DUF2235 family)